jgi:hypothetical protein
LQDQSVQQAARGGGRQAGLDDYNPFEKDNQTKPAAGVTYLSTLLYLKKCMFFIYIL